MPSARTEVNGTHQILVSADDVNMLVENINIIQENTRVLLQVGKWG